MKALVLTVICLAPALAFGQQAYTNEDLTRMQLPGAYTNEDLKRLSPLAVQTKPAAELPEFAAPRPPTASLQARYDGLGDAHRALRDEIVYEGERIDFSESAFAGDTRDNKVRLGYRSRGALLLMELEKRARLLETRIDAILDQARRAGAILDRR